MTWWEFFGSWYFWGPLLFCVVGLIAIAYIEQRERDKYCPTCMSDRKRNRYKVRYWISDNLYNEQLCEDEWHEGKF